MRVIGGKFSGRLLKPKMKNWPTRPTTDIAKEALFNILENRLNFDQIKMLDLFGGVGNHSFEFISRGCRRVTYVDQNKHCVHFVREQSSVFECETEIQVIQQEVKKFIHSTRDTFNYIFAGPPYPLVWLRNIPNFIFENNLLEEDGLLVLEHNPNHDFINHPHFSQKRKYGQTIFSFFAV